MNRISAPHTHCQPLMAGFPGYRPYCPYTLHPTRNGRWRAPDLAEARRLVSASSTRGERVDVWGTTDEIGVPPPVPRYIAGVLRRLGYRVKLHRVPLASLTPKTRRRIQLSVDGDWFPDYPLPSAYLPQFFGCHGGTSNGYVCDPKLDRQMLRADALQLQDSRRASTLWTQVDHELTDRAYWVPTENLHEPELVSRRVRNFQLSPVGDFLADQIWLR
jgi:ABC-type transport system substrate-binding protein